MNYEMLLFCLLQSFDYTELCQPGQLLDNSGGGGGGLPVTVNNIGRGTVGVAHPGGQNSPTTSLGGNSANGTPATRSRPWHDFGRQNDADKIQIPKM